MKSILALLSLAALTAAVPVANPVAAPVDIDAIAELETRQLGGTTANNFVDGGCRDVIFMFARGSTEPGNMGTVIGPPLARNLQSEFGRDNVAVQGIDYPAALATNFIAGGADRGGIRTMADLITQAAADCPDSSIVVGGYSQGAALVHRAVEDLPADVMGRIDGAVTFGDTQNLQDRGQIPNFPPEKTEVFCATGDLVCVGTLNITPAHLSYGGDADQAADFLVGRINAA